jgi:hypothetical protein
VRGNINDPEFSYGKIIFNALLNLIAKIVTSPFAALGSLFGGGEDMSHIDFGYGSAALTPEHTEKLETVARALYERPALRLEIRGVADRTSDRAALAEKRLMRELKKLKAGKCAPSIRRTPPMKRPSPFPARNMSACSQRPMKPCGRKRGGQRKTGCHLQEMKQALIDAMVIGISTCGNWRRSGRKRSKGTC